MRSILCALLLLSLPQAAHSQRDSIAAVTLRPGDILNVTVWRRTDLSGELVVGSDGRLVHPILRRVEVTGVPYSEVVLRLGQLLREFDGNEQFALQPLLQVAVAGEVRQPGLYHIPPGSTVADAVARAGGHTERGSLERVRFVRDRTSRQLDLLDPTGEGAIVGIRSGDQIFVTRRRDILRDFIVPAATFVAAAASVLRLFQE